MDKAIIAETQLANAPVLNPSWERIRNTILGGVYGAGLIETNKIRPSYTANNFPSVLCISPTTELGLYLSDSLTELSQLDILRFLEEQDYQSRSVNKNILRTIFARYLSNWLSDEYSTFDVPVELLTTLQYIKESKNQGEIIHGDEFAFLSDEDIIYRDWLSLSNLGHNQAIALSLLQASITHHNPLSYATLALYNSFLWHNSRNLGPGQYQDQDILDWGIEQAASLSNVFGAFSEIYLGSKFTLISDTLKDIRKNLKNQGVSFNHQINTNHKTLNAFLKALLAWRSAELSKTDPETLLLDTVVTQSHTQMSFKLLGELLGSGGQTFPENWYQSLNGITQDKLFHAIKRIQESKFYKPYR